VHVKRRSFRKRRIKEIKKKSRTKKKKKVKGIRITSESRADGRRERQNEDTNKRGVFIRVVDYDDGEEGDSADDGLETLLSSDDGDGEDDGEEEEEGVEDDDDEVSSFNSSSFFSSSPSSFLA